MKIGTMWASQNLVSGTADFFPVCADGYLKPALTAALVGATVLLRGEGRFC
jgi:hypothetical protein